jgi:uncharacterized membrane protein
MFVALLVVLLVAAAVHITQLKERTPRRGGEIMLLYLLVGYCGIPMLLVSVAMLVWPAHVAAHLGFPAGNPFQAFLAVAYLGMSLLSVLTLRYRGAFVIGPAIIWTVFFAGATVIHLRDFHHRGALTHGGVLVIFTTHGLIAVLLAGALLMSGLLTKRS